MAFTSIKVQEADKRVFDRLRHEVALRTGAELSQHELFHRILAQALALKPQLMGLPPVQTDWSRFQFDLGATDAHADLDRMVYGLDQ